MPVSRARYYRDFMKLPEKLGWLHHCSRFFIKIIAIALQFPILDKFFKKTFFGTCGLVGLLRAKNQHLIAADHLMSLLKEDRFREGDNFQWWYLMRLAVTLLQDRQLCGDQHVFTRIHDLIRLGITGPLPKGGYDVAYSFVGFALWNFQQGKLQDARLCIQHAIEADTTWGYPEYLMGWFGLFDKEIDAVTHFVKAVHCDWKALHRMKRDPVCQLHPGIIKQVMHQMVVEKQQTNDNNKPMSL